MRLWVPVRMKIYLLIGSLFNGAASISDYMKLRMINEYLIEKEMVVV
jgi:hypothetical protein